ncbi:hypothetical protein A3A39_04485 [Candidatus Kaiserbacteria bacterium RIFCSPLOWO2_01_FULL_54_13]|uniref:GIY-YIG domain-containing protein n=1 Tax=Candidatus Kaiserbacteria bacterium RIFCSPLOWO2_01_FULL_54_13 TaxID=1798512 RepID=A0A1F6F1K0_9BACT|nr:MAG: hypothetical protein A3A39_04485 [Candidatus Kaiserbacteria bacterium RIFCSPLOWO2_01_FULL_54_13]
MAWVYILQTKNGQYYIGSTTDLERRIRQHMHGHTRTTNRLQLSAVALKQEYKTIEDARNVERKIKKMKRKDYIEKMIKDGYIKVAP